MVGSWTKCLSRKVLRQHEHSSLIVTGNDKTQKYTASVENCDVWTQTENKSYYKNTEQVHLSDIDFATPLTYRHIGQHQSSEAFRLA